MSGIINLDSDDFDPVMHALNATIRDARLVCLARNLAVAGALARCRAATLEEVAVDLDDQADRAYVARDNAAAAGEYAIAIEQDAVVRFCEGAAMHVRGTGERAPRTDP